MIRQVVIQIEPGEIPSLLSLDLVDLELGENHAALGVVWVGQGEKPLGPEVLLPDFLRGHIGQLFLGHSRGQSGPDPFLNNLCSAGHHHTLRWPVAQVVSIIE